MLPVILGVVALSALVFSACGESKDKTKDAAPPPPPPPPPPPKPQCDAFKKGSGDQYMIDQQSYDAMTYIWGKDTTGAKASNWHIDARIFFGATATLYRTTCDDANSFTTNTETYFTGVRAFFENHYNEKADQSENGMLVLIGGIAPADIDENAFLGAVMTMDTVADMNGMEHPYGCKVVELMKACYYYNLATKDIPESDRFSKPLGRKLPSKKEKGEELSKKEQARQNLEKAEKLLGTFTSMSPEMLNMALTDRQQKILFTLLSAIGAYGKTFGKGRKGGGGTGEGDGDDLAVNPPPPDGDKWTMPNPGAS